MISQGVLSKSLIFSIFLLISGFFVFVFMPLEGKSASTLKGEVNFTILHTNDEHSSLLPHSPAVDHDPGNENDPTIGGFARLATAVENIRNDKRKTGEPVLLFNAGDFLGGSSFGWLAPAGYSAELSIMHAMGYDAVIIGNHEYDYGPKVLGEYLINAGYPEAHNKTPVLASNTTPPENYLLASENLLRDTAVFELDNGLTIGTFGLIGKNAISVTAETGDIVFEDQHETARLMVKKLKEKGVDVIVAIIHAGVDYDEDQALARAVPEIDVIVGGHCHSALHDPLIVEDTIIVQSGSLVKYLGYLELAYNADTGKVRVRNSENDKPHLIPIDNTLSLHPQINALVQDYTVILNRLISEITGGMFNDIKEVLVRSDFKLPRYPPLQETQVGNFITDGMRIITQEITGKKVDVAIQANGSIRESIIPGTMDYSRGDVSFYDITEVMGLGYGKDGYAGYPIVSTYLTGEELRRALEVAALLKELMGNTYFIQFSGITYDYNPVNTVLLTVPFIDLPVPTTRAVKRAELYTGDGIQPAPWDAKEGDYIPLEKGDEQLYNVVTDLYFLSFLPMAGDLLPQLEIVPKTEEGEPVPIDELSRLIVHYPDGRELKGWETLVRYAAAQPYGEDGFPLIDASYEETSARINPVGGFPYVAWVYIFLIAVAAGIFYLVRRRINK